MQWNGIPLSSERELAHNHMGKSQNNSEWMKSEKENSMWFNFYKSLENGN